jgi:uncharacterized protein with NRDE domain
VCLLIALSRTVDGAPLVIGANRDEFYGRPATAMTVLQERGPRLLGGRDHLAGGTWLAVSEHGVVAGLTNQPSASGPRRDPSKRSRGELPLMFAAYPDAATAVEQVCAKLDPGAYNPCWLLVGDRQGLFSVGLAGGTAPEVRELPPGQYVLENVPLDPARTGPAARWTPCSGCCAATRSTSRSTSTAPARRWSSRCPGPAGRSSCWPRARRRGPRSPT